MSDIDRILESYRAAAVSEREKGTYFERLAKAFLLADPIQSEEFAEVWTWSEWAGKNGFDGRDVGIDLVAKLRNEEGYAAVQAKFYGSGARIRKEDIDSFVSASGKEPFRRRVVVDTTEGEWSENAEEMVRGQAIPVVRIGLSDLRASRIDWTAFEVRGEAVLRERKDPLPHQMDALEAVRDGLAEADRGKLIMACGTGKTFTSLKIAEAMAGAGGRVLFMVPSLALMAQSVREWINDCAVPIRAFAVCSDSQVGKRRASSDDVAEIEVHDLAFPATTDAAKLAGKGSVADEGRMTVVFATYQSIATITKAHGLGLPEFDLAICDEAHRTTGATLEDGEESAFVRVHSDEHVKARKRLYMTATPRIFGDAAKTKADEVGAEIVSMDIEEMFGKTLFHRGFGWAVQNGLLTDYKVIVLAMDEGLVSASVQKRLADADSELVLDDATKILGCYKALTKRDLKEDLGFDPAPMRRALAFCKSIAASKLIRDEFSAVVSEYFEETGEEDEGRLDVEIEHIDGTYKAKARTALLDWLKEEADEGVCRILTNARCLSEGVDVPSLDAIMFLHPRKSQIDVVQSVGRVMRRAPGKRMGYVILPVGVPAGVPPEQALNDNERYRVVWQILNALRAHDERFDATVNKMSLGQDVSDTIEIVGVSASAELKAVTATVESLPSKAKAARSSVGTGFGEAVTAEVSAQGEMVFPIDEFSRAIIAKIVRKCGTRDYWEEWAGNIADIAKAHITRIEGILAEPGTPAREAFDSFLAELRDDLNESVTEGDAVEMLAQHIITRPVFETLFEGHAFTSENPVSKAMQGVLDVLDEANLDKESKDLERFYASVRTRSQGITDPQARQRLVVELYEKFFKKAFPKTTDRLGIVYTPIEIVDFIIRSVDETLRSEFGQTLASEGVHILDPFTGTGTFVTRLLQSGLIPPEDLERKYRTEIHANEIVLLAYYIAAINVESVYHAIMGGEYAPFEGICLTDTFRMHETEDLISHHMPDNSERRKRQKDLDITVVMGNPPYSVGQEDANENNANVSYPTLDGRIRDTYAARSTATNKAALYDSYIRAIRWASDRIGESGVVAFVAGAGWIDGNAADGMRACLAEEFTAIHIFHLRGNQRTVGEKSRREGGKIFGSGSRTPIAIAVFVRNPASADRGRIFFHDVGDYLTREEKLRIVKEYGSVGGVSAAGGWTEVVPDAKGDWIRQRDASFDAFMRMGDKKDATAKTIFANYSRGIETARDAWVYNPSRRTVAAAMERTVAVYNEEVDRLRDNLRPMGSKAAEEAAKGLVDMDATKISWSSSLIAELCRGNKAVFDDGRIVPCVYRPFARQWLYYDDVFVHRTGQMRQIFPMGREDNRIIMVKQRWSGEGHLALMLDCLVDLQSDGGAQCFPLKLHEPAKEGADDLFSRPSRRGEGGLAVRDGITDEALAEYRAAYPDASVSKEDIFYYVYGILHSQDYRAAYADNLSREIPRIPLVASADDFRAFRDAGRELGDLHAGFDKVDPYPATIRQGDLRLADIRDPESFYRVTKWGFGKKGKEKDRSVVVYNPNITVEGIPDEAWGYVVNGKPALDWVIERQTPKADKASGIMIDPNRYAVETVRNPAYPLELFLRMVTVSLRTQEIVRGLPLLSVRSS